MCVCTVMTIVGKCYCACVCVCVVFTLVCYVIMLLYSTIAISLTIVDTREVDGDSS